MPEVAPGFPKLDKQTRPWKCRDGIPGCSKTRLCVHCRGRRNRRSGMTKQRSVLKVIEALLGVDRPKYASRTSNEEVWDHLPIRVEVKSGQQVKSIHTKYLEARGQSDAAKAVGNAKPFWFVALPAGLNVLDGYVVIRIRDVSVDLLGGEV